MVHLRLVATALVLAGFTASLSANENGVIAALRNEIKVLRAQEKATVRAIHLQYDAMIKRDKVAEQVLEQERRALAIQEKELLAVATTTEQKDEIRIRYETLRAALNTDIKLDAKQIDQLRRSEHAHIKYVEMAYNAKVKMLESEIHAIEHAPKPKKK
jgi:hypothetical protein